MIASGAVTDPGAIDQLRLLNSIVARTIEPRSIYDARLSDAEIETRQKVWEMAHMPPTLVQEVDQA